jgi:glycosyltransferase involved in cell wall biosynthesis
LIDELFPQLLDKIQLNIIGKDLPNYLVNKIKGIQGINYLGFIDDVDGFLASQMMMVAPIQIGSGLKMKIPHALACGTVVITTPVGAEGIGLEESDGLWIADSNETMVDIINNNIDELDLMIKQGLSGRNAVKEKFSENNIIPKFEILYSEILQA